MPSPIGHALGAVAAGWWVGGTVGASRDLVRRGLLLAAVGVAPDLDLLMGRHSAETHSIGAAVIVAVVAAAMRWPVAATRMRIFWAVALAWLSHPLLDWLGSDDSLPLGVMLFWPFSHQHYLAGISLFDPITRRYWLPGFIPHTLLAITRELAILTPIAALSWFVARRRKVDDQ